MGITRRLARKESFEKKVLASRESSLSAVVRLNSETLQRMGAQIVQIPLQRSKSMASLREIPQVSENYACAFVTTEENDEGVMVRRRERSLVSERHSLNTRAASVESSLIDVYKNQIIQESYTKNLPEKEKEKAQRKFELFNVKTDTFIEADSKRVDSRELVENIVNEKVADQVSFRLKEQQSVEAGLSGFSKISPRKSEAQEVDVTLEEQVKLGDKLQTKASISSVTLKDLNIERVEKMGEEEIVVRQKSELAEQALKNFSDQKTKTEEKLIAQDKTEPVDVNLREKLKDFQNLTLKESQDESSHLFVSTNLQDNDSSLKVRLSELEQIEAKLSAPSNETVAASVDLNAVNKLRAENEIPFIPSEAVDFKYGHSQETTLISMEREHYRMAEETKADSFFDSSEMRLKEFGEKKLGTLANLGYLEPKKPESQETEIEFPQDLRQSLSLRMSAPVESKQECTCNLVREMAQKEAVRQLKERIGASTDLKTAAIVQEVIMMMCEVHRVTVRDLLFTEQSIQEKTRAQSEGRFSEMREENLYGFWSTNLSEHADKLLKSPLRSADSVSLASLASSEETSIAEAVLNRRPSLAVDIVLRSAAREANVSSLGFERAEFSQTFKSEPFDEEATFEELKSTEIQKCTLKQLETINELNNEKTNLKVIVGKLEQKQQKEHSAEAIKISTSSQTLHCDFKWAIEFEKIRILEENRLLKLAVTDASQLESEQRFEMIGEMKCVRKTQLQPIPEEPTALATMATDYQRLTVSEKRELSEERTFIETRSSQTELTIVEAIESILEASLQRSQAQSYADVTKDALNLKNEVFSTQATILEEIALQLQRAKCVEGETSQSVKESEREKATKAYKELIEEIQGLTTVWDVVQTNQEAKAQWKEKRDETKMLNVQAPKQESINLSQEFDKMTQGEANYQLMEKIVDSQRAQRQFSLDEHTFDSRFSRESSRSETTFTIDTHVEGSVERRLKELGDEEIVTSGLFGRIFSREAESAESMSTFDDARTFRQFLRTLASQNISSSIIHELDRLPECDQSIHNIQVKNILRKEAQFFASRETSVEQMIEDFQKALEHREALIELQQKNREKVEKTALPTEENMSFSNYETIVNDLKESKTFREMSLETNQASIKAPIHSEIGAYMSLEKAAYRQAQIEKPLKRGESVDKRFEIEIINVEILERSRESQPKDIEARIDFRGKSEDRNVATFNEYSEKTIEICNLFGRIIQKRFEAEDVEKNRPQARKWIEELRKEAAQFIQISSDFDLNSTKVDELTTKTQKECVKLVSSCHLNAMKVENVNFCQEFRKELCELFAEITVKERMFERNILKCKQLDWSQRLTDSTWETILDEIETEYHQKLAITERESLQIKVSEEIRKDFSVEEIRKDFPVEEILRSTPAFTTSSVDGKSLLTTESEPMIKCETSLRHEDLFTEVESLLQEKRHEEWKADFPEFLEEEIKAGVQLVKKSLPKPKELVDHVIHVDTSFKQVMNTVAVKESQAFAQLEIRGKQRGDESTSTSRKQKVKDQVILHSKQSFDVSAEASKSLTKQQSFQQETIRTFKAALREKSVEHFKELDNDEFEILSEYIGVYRDLDAEISIRGLGKLNSSFVFSTPTSTEEVITLNTFKERFVASAETKITLKFTPKDSFVQKLSVADSRVECSLVSSHKSSLDFTCTLSGKNFEYYVGKFHETSETQLKAIINLHRVDIVRPSQKNEVILAEILSISVEPLRIQGVDKSVIHSVELKKEAMMLRIDRMIVATNRGESMKKSFKEAGDERTKLAVELIGKKGGQEFLIKEWRIPNEVKGASLEVEEFGDESCVLYAQINDKHQNFDETEIEKKISRTHEGVKLITRASTEITAIINNSFEIPELFEEAKKLIVIGNKGESLVVRYKESQENHTAIGQIFNIQPETHIHHVTVNDKRFGGQYNLSKKASSDVYRELTQALVRSGFLEHIRHRYVQKQKAQLSMRVLESTTVQFETTERFQKSEQKASFDSLRRCAQTCSPAFIKLRELSETQTTTFCSFQKPQSIDYLSKIYAIPRIERQLLNCDAAEENEIKSSPELSKPFEFKTVDILVVDFNHTPPLSLSTKQATIEIKTIPTNFLREPAPAQSAQLTITIANQCSPIKIHVKESREEKQTTCAQFSVPSLTSQIEITRKIAIFGGNYRKRFDACEEHEISVNRELITAKPLTIHCSQAAIRLTKDKAIFFAKASTNIRINIFEDYVKVCSKEAIERLFNAPNLSVIERRLVEAVDTLEILNPIYVKEEQHHYLDKVLREARDGGRQDFNVKATQEKAIETTIELSNQRLARGEIEIKTIVPNTAKSLAYHASASGNAISVIYQQLSKSSERETIREVIHAKNKGQSIAFKVKESKSEQQTTNVHLSKRESFLSQEKLIIEARFGGSFKLTSIATSFKEITVNVDTQKQKPTSLLAENLKIIGNKAAPIDFRTIATSNKICEIYTVLNKANQSYEENIKISAPNKGQITVFTARETSQIHESTNLAYQKDPQSDTLLKTIVERRFGGALSLSTSSSKESLSSLSGQLTSTRLAAIDVQKLIICPNLATPLVLFAHSSTQKTIDIGYVWEKPASIEETRISVRDHNKAQPVKFRAIEAGEVQENLTVQLNRSASTNVAEKTTQIPNQSAQIAPLKKYAAGDRHVQIAPHLENPKPILLSTAVTLTARNTAQSQQLHCACALYATTSTSVDLCRTQYHEKVDSLRLTAHTHPPVKRDFNESTSFHILANFMYAREEKKEIFAETRREANYGGNFVLRTNASKSSDVVVEATIAKEKVLEMNAEIKKIIANKANPLEKFASATQETITGATCQFQKTNAHETTVEKIIAKRIGEPISRAVKESTSLEIVNNIQWKREDEHKEIDLTVKIPQNGGQLKLETRKAEEKSLDIHPIYERKSSIQETMTVKTTSNKAQPVSFSSGASSERSSSTDHNVVNPKPSTASASIVIVDKNRAQPVTMRVSESKEADVSMNFALVKEGVRDLQAEITKDEPRFGGSLTIGCKAAKEEKPDTVSRTFTKEEGKENSEKILKTSRDEKIFFGSKATQELNVSIEISIESARAAKLENSNQISETVRTIGNLEKAAHGSRQAEEKEITIHHELRNKKLDDKRFSEEEADRMIPIQNKEQESFGCRSTEEHHYSINCDFSQQTTSYNVTISSEIPSIGEAIGVKCEAAQETEFTLDLDIRKGGAADWPSEGLRPLSEEEEAELRARRSQEEMFNLNLDINQQTTELIASRLEHVAGTHEPAGFGARRSQEVHFHMNMELTNQGTQFRSKGEFAEWCVAETEKMELSTKGVDRDEIRRREEAREMERLRHEESIQERERSVLEEIAALERAGETVILLDSTVICDQTLHDQHIEVSQKDSLRWKDRGIEEGISLESIIQENQEKIQEKIQEKVEKGYKDHQLYEIQVGSDQ
ncbi:unnamed protein product, partial [Mesorhabditis belari]|uniref:Uncharacterized protein n=1 Tax=Mesorhabditis belari TaxID=2138241 RepID=A0AAF3EYI0_9BILA